MKYGKIKTLSYQSLPQSDPSQYQELQMGTVACSHYPPGRGICVRFTRLFVYASSVMMPVAGDAESCECGGRYWRCRKGRELP